MKEGVFLVKKSTKVILAIIILLLCVIPLLTLKGAEFGGSDDQAEGVIEEVNPDYEPWFEPLIEPASGEIESLLFALQASIGAGVIFYYLGYNRGKKHHESH